MIEYTRGNNVNARTPTIHGLMNSNPRRRFRQSLGVNPKRPVASCAIVSPSDTTIGPAIDNAECRRPARRLDTPAGALMAFRAQAEKISHTPPDDEKKAVQRDVNSAIGHRRCPWRAAMSSPTRRRRVNGPRFVPACGI
ncbi:hypothetical protein [Microlunatus endophyticus]